MRSGEFGRSATAPVVDPLLREYEVHTQMKVLVSKVFRRRMHAVLATWLRCQMMCHGSLAGGADCNPRRDECDAHDAGGG